LALDQFALTLGYNQFPWPGSSVGRAED
jgi:hypothetical protein